jgi:uncharacterized protein (TIGR00255 family)
MEEKIKKLIGAHTSRAKADAFLTVENTASDTLSICIDKVYAEAYIAALRDLQSTFGLCDDISTMSVARNQEVFTVEKTKEDEDAFWNDVREVAEQALCSYDEMRLAEGEKLYNFFIDSLDIIAKYVDEIEKLSPATLEAYRERLKARITEMLGDTQVDEGRLLTECAIFADKISVTEELTRLRSHIAQFKAILTESVPVGRKLDFLTQELNREINTVGSKASDTAIAKIVIEVKSEIEKIREQVQNVE